ncbi:MAG: MlaD family protein [Vicinamibacterales bacterium]
MARSREAVVGAFVLGGVLLFAAGLFLIGERRMLFSDQFRVSTTFTKVTGLVVGTQVRVAGLNAGEVTEIDIPSRPSDPFVVHLRIREDVQALVRTDSVCDIQTDGIVGNTFVQVSPGSDDAPRAGEGAVLPGRDPIEFADLIREGRDTFQDVSDQIVQLTGDVSGMVDAATGTVEATQRIVERQGDHVDAIMTASTRTMADVQRTVADVRTVVDGVRRGEGTVGRLLTDTTFYDQMTNVGAEAQRTAQAVRETVESARAAVQDFTSPEGGGARFSTSIRGTLSRVDEVTSDLAESTEALKRNFLFSGYFRDRGFFDLDSISREAYREGLLERGRTAVRIWLDADLLFAPSGTPTDAQRPADTAGRLTDEGRQRLDAAMAQLLQYPLDTPLVVEGYARDGTVDHQYLVSLDRARRVRDYLLERFDRDEAHTGVMPLGDEAPGSPSNDGSWSGVALTMFVSNDALRGGS